VATQAVGRVRVAEVVLDHRTAGLEARYTYAAPETAERGQAWVVPLGPRRALGYVLAVRDAPADGLGFPQERLRPLAEPVAGLDLPAAVLDLVEETARQALCPVEAALTAATPPGVRERIATVWRPGREPEKRLPPAQAEAYALLRERGTLYEGGGSTMAGPLSRALRALARDGHAERGLEFRRWAEQRAGGSPIALSPDSDAIESFLAGAGRKRPAQAIALIRLQGLGTRSFTHREARALAGVSDQTVQSLLDSGLLVPAGDGHAAPDPAPGLNPEQAAAVAEVSKAVTERRHEAFLLFGVTGSGKTEVYLRAAAEALRMGRPVLYLVPEIALTAQTLARLRGRFGDQVAMLHSNLPTRARLDNWAAVRNGSKTVVLGARSALFAPLADVGLVVVDEEHESSFKQETAPRYSAGPLAEFLAHRHGAPIVFGSATPSLESFDRARRGGMRLLRLDRRAAAAQLPAVEALDLRELYRSQAPALVSPALRSALEQTLERGEQAILFLNRRAYAPSLQCRACGHAWECPRCSVTLAYHRRDAQLRCHHCGHAQAAPLACPDCESDQVGALGVGVQRVEEALATLVPNARVARLDRDVARRSGALEETLARFRAGDLDVLVGTQLVAKGLDFPKVTLVGAVAADVSLHVPDFRASERTFQLLSQVAGRAGRAERPGRVLIQTFQPEHRAVQRALCHDYEGFFEAELEERRAARYPPFVRLVNVLVTGADHPSVTAVSAVAAERLRAALPGGEVLGPADCPIARLDGLWRRHALVKLPLGTDPGPVATALEGLETTRVRVFADVDPASLS
jgi:primosomal protein N' (replication factor Y)